MSRSYRIALVSMALALAACHNRAKPPTGQVAAVVDGHEITVRQLNAELGGNVPSDPKALKTVQSRALQSIVMRTLLADKAKKDGLNKGPDYAIEDLRLTDGLLAALYQKKLAAAVPQPTDDEANAFINSHPESFSQRKIFTVDQLLIPATAPAAALKSLVPLNNIDEAKSALQGQNVPFKEQTVEIDSVDIDPRLVAALAKLTSNDMLMVPQNGIIILNAVKSARIQPLTGDKALTYAKSAAHAASVREAEGRQLQSLMHEAAPTIAFNPAYKPPPGQTPAPVSNTPPAS